MRGNLDPSPKGCEMNEQSVVLNDSEPLTTDEQATADAADKYGQDNVQIFRDTAHIRQRPSMYIGDIAASGLHHLVYELVYNSVDEALAGHCRNIHVKINVDGSLSVERRRPRHPGRRAPRGQAADARSRHDHGRRRRQVRQEHLQGLRRPARHRRQGGDGPERVGRGRGAPQRPGLRAGVRARQGRSPRCKDRRRRQAAPARASPSSPTRRSSTRPPSTTTRWRPGCASWPSSTRAWRIKLTDERTGKEEMFKLRRRHRRVRRSTSTALRRPLHKPIYIDKTGGRRPRRGGPAVHHRRGGARPLLRQQRLQLRSAART